MRSINPPFAEAISTQPAGKGHRPAMAFTALAILLTAFGCQSEPATPVPPARDPIAIEYVRVPDLAVHTRPDDASPVTTHFLSGESVSILSKKTGWAEIRTATGSGWAHEADLAGAAEAKAEEDNPTPRFRIAPSAASEPGAHGTVYIEATVNNEGDVVHTQVITNTTGSDTLALRNQASIQAAKFYPIVVKGEKKGFVYYYRVDY